MALPAVARAPGVGNRGVARRWEWATAGALPGLTSAWSRRATASARPSLRLLRAAQARR